MKKLSVALLVFTAQFAQAAPPPYSGFYASIAGGGTITDFNVDQDFVAMIAGNFEAALPSNINMQGGSATGLIGVGYSYPFQNNFVLGTEVVAEWTNTEIAHKDELFNIGLGTVGGELKARLHNDFALLFKAGYVFHHKTQLYVLLGPRYGNFKTSITSNYSTVSARDEESGYQWGVTAGTGLEHLITDHLSLGIEYAYTDYGHIESPHTDSSDGGAPPLIVTNDVDIKASSNTVLAKLSYHF
jgi:opacity protein-like surface antigen